MNLEEVKKRLMPYAYLHYDPDMIFSGLCIRLEGAKNTEQAK